MGFVWAPVPIFSSQGSCQVVRWPFPQNGKHILTGSWDKTAKLWDLAGHEIQSFFGHAEPVWSVAFSPDGKQS
ncbi:MAG: hypothetical protein IPH31_14470 [Lewinellaceae bacterium]|nr:hypothetical protein [Lewinellaceae bacterium]